MTVFIGMTYKIANPLILRKPAGTTAGFHLNVAIILSDPHFRASLYIASPGFYATLDGLAPEHLSAKQRLTIYKYYNRFCYRPTPFGLFSSVTLLSFNNSSPAPAYPSIYEVSTHLSQAYDLKIGQQYIDEYLRPVMDYEPNPTLYRVLKEYRFIITSLDEDYKKREYLLQSIGYTKTLDKIIRFCRTGRRGEDLILYIAAEAECTLDEASEYFGFLTDVQILLYKKRPNITGPAFTELLEKEYLQVLLKPALSTALSQANGRLDLKNLPGCYDRFKQLGQAVELTVSPERKPYNTDHFNIQLGAEPDGETCLPGWKEQLRDGIFALSCLTQEQPLQAMMNFVRAYQKHFEGRQIPLLMALDPEAGLGYQHPLNEPLNPLLETLVITPHQEKQDHLHWTSAHSFLLNCWHQCEGEGIDEIIITDEGLASLEQTQPFQTLGQSILFRQANEHLYIESIGGTNAPALAGRFTASFSTIKEAALQISREQESLNPGVIFAEILHLSDTHVDNINRRAQLYSYEIPLTAASVLPKEQQLQLSDLYVHVTGNKVYLFSSKHGKMVIPRLTSAYNHSINQLPLFRFLADLPYQYGSSGFSLDLSHFFPGLHFYPRITYRQVILHLATWVLREKQIRQLTDASSMDLIGAFKKLQSEIKLPDVFMLAQADQQLVFNTQKPDEIEFFLACIQSLKQVILKEYLAQNSPDGAITADPQFTRQYNAFLLPTDPIPMPALPPRHLKSQPKHRKFIPGSEWLYLKIYISKTGANPLLIKLQPLLQKVYSHGPIKKWFFIRYEDHAPHIRLRLHICPDDTGEILVVFKNALSAQIGGHVIREYQLDVYSREMERYQAGDYGLTESHFAASSNLVVRSIRRSTDQMPDPYLLALTTTRDLLNIFLPAFDEQLLFVLETYGLFVTEFNDPNLKIGLDRKYRELSIPINKAMTDPGYYRKAKVSAAAKEFLHATAKLEASVTTGHTERRDYLRSIIHMHLNRVYSDQARKQEMITYYFLYKHLSSVKARKTSAGRQ